MGAGQSSDEVRHRDVDEVLYPNGRQHDSHPNMSALRAAARLPTPPANPPPEFLPDLPFDLIVIINIYRESLSKEQRSLSILPDWIWEQTISPSYWTYSDICMVFGNKDFQNWLYARYADGTKTRGLDLLLEHLSSWLFHASIDETRLLGTQILQRNQTRIYNYRYRSKVEKLRAYFEVLNMLCTDDRYRCVRTFHSRCAGA